MKSSRIVTFAIGLLATAAVSVACASVEGDPVATPTVLPADPTPTSVPSALVSEQVRELPPLLLSEDPPNAAVQGTLWFEYLRGGTMRSLDGRHSLEMCGGHYGFKGRATGDLVIGDTWSAQQVTADYGPGWDHTGLWIFGEENDLVAYYFVVIDGVPTLLHNPDASSDVTKANPRLFWRVPEIKMMPFEVVDGAECL